MGWKTCQGIKIKIKIKKEVENRPFILWRVGKYTRWKVHRNFISQVKMSRKNVYCIRYSLREYNHAALQSSNLRIKGLQQSGSKGPCKTQQLSSTLHHNLSEIFSLHIHSWFLIKARVWQMQRVTID